MVLYTCPQVQLIQPIQKNDYRKHLNRKKPCIVRNVNIPLEICRKEFLGVTNEKLLKN